MKKLICILLCAALALLFCSCRDNGSQSTENSKTVPADTEQTAAELVSKMGIGINIGNTMDSWPGGDETAWGCPRITAELLDSIKEQGFKTVRIPVTYYETIGPAPDYTVSAEWLDRVYEVVKTAYNKGFYVITNMHHEGNWLMTKTDDLENMKQKFTSVWKQIAEKLAGFGDMLMFEGFNEVRDGDNWTGDSESFDIINELNSLFVSTVRATGGNNAGRYLILNTYAGSCSSLDISCWEKPQDAQNIIASVHCYQPSDFCFNWGSGVFDKDTATTQLEGIFSDLDLCFIQNGIPVVIGEFGCVNRGNTQDRVEYIKIFRSLCEKYGVSAIWWDNGLYGEDTDKENFGLLDRSTYEWKFPEIVQALIG